MVVKGDFKVELVEAETKLAFKEHVKDGETYVEVEPKVEYYLRIERIKTSLMGPLKLRFYVDETSLKNSVHYEDSSCRKPFLIGAYEYKDGIKYKQRLKFVLPNISLVSRSGESNMNTPWFRTVEVKVCKAIRQKHHIDTTAHISNCTFAQDPLKLCDNSSSKHSIAKCVRSGVGDKEKHNYSTSNYTSGRIIDTIFLHYATLPGLLHGGVLPKPSNIYECHRLMTGTKRLHVDPVVTTPKRIKTLKKIYLGEDQVGTEEIIQEFFDLTNLPSDDEDEPNSQIPSDDAANYQAKVFNEKNYNENAFKEEEE